MKYKENYLSIIRLRFEFLNSYIRSMTQIVLDGFLVPFSKKIEIIDEILEFKKYSKY